MHGRRAERASASRPLGAPSTAKPSSSSSSASALRTSLSSSTIRMAPELMAVFVQLFLWTAICQGTGIPRMSNRHVVNSTYVKGARRRPMSDGMNSAALDRRAPIRGARRTTSSAEVRQAGVARRVRVPALRQAAAHPPAHDAAGPVGLPAGGHVRGGERERAADAAAASGDARRALAKTGGRAGDPEGARRGRSTASGAVGGVRARSRRGRSPVPGPLDAGDRDRALGRAGLRGQHGRAAVDGRRLRDRQREARRRATTRRWSA